MKAKDLMKLDLTSVSDTARLKEAAGLLAKTHLSGLPVVNDKNQVIGFISERDIIAAAFPETILTKTPEIISLANLSLIVKKLSSKGNLKVKDYLSHELYHVGEETPLHDIIELMLEKNLKRLPVSRDKQLVGIIERATLSRVALEQGL
ncbi:MAG: CBS domain-containing protein [Candidatus Margulisiibacteriota bacterium]